MKIALGPLSKGSVYHLVTQTLIPRPIAWVLTKAPQGHYNLAPFSYFTAVSSEPPLLMFSADKKAPGQLKDTVANLKHHHEVVIHIAQGSSVEALNETSRTLPQEVSELNTIEHELVYDLPHCSLPRLKGEPIAFAGRMHTMQTLEGTSQTLLFVQIETLHIDKEYVTLSEYRNKKGEIKQSYHVDALKVDPLTRLGHGEYGLLGQILDIARPK